MFLTELVRDVWIGGACVLSARECGYLTSILEDEANADAELIEDVAQGRESSALLPDAFERLKVCAKVARMIAG